MFRVEDGTGLADADAYVDLAFVRSHLADRGLLSDWDGVGVATSITGADDVADALAIAEHPFETGDGPVRFVGDDLPAGLSTETAYWLVAADAATVQVATSRANAVAVPPTVIDVTSAGSGEMRVAHPDFDGQRAAIVRATDHIELAYASRFLGCRLVATQALSWPRQDAYTADGLALDGIPAALGRATAQYALRARSAPLSPDSDTGGAIQSIREAAGGLSKSVTYAGAASGNPSYPAADRLMGALLRPRRLVRA